MDVKSFITPVLSAILGGLVVLVFSGLVGNQSGPDVGAGTRFPNGISVDSTSPSAGELRGTTVTATGALTADTVSAASSGSQFGADSSVNYLYIGAGDGCAAVYFAASTTQTVQATSSAFCN